MSDATATHEMQPESANTGSTIDTQKQQLEFESFLLESVSDSVIAYYPADPDKGKLVYANEAAYKSRGYTHDEILQLNVMDLIAPEWRPVLQGRLDDLSSGKEVRGESAHLRKDGSIFPVEIWLRQVEFGGRPLVVNVSRDVSERKQDERLLREALDAEHQAQQRATQELGTSRILLEAATTVGETLDLREVLLRLGVIVQRLTGNTRVFIASVDIDTWTVMPVVVSSREFDHPAGSEAIPFDRLSELVRQAFLDKRTTYLDYEGDAVSDYDRKIAEMNDGRLLLFVPIRTGADMFGHLTVDIPGERREFSPREVELVEGVAAQAALALKNARLFQAELDELARTSLLQDVSEAAGSALDPETVSNRVLRAIRDHVGLQAGDVRLLDETTDSLRLLASIGWPEATKQRLAMVPVRDVGWMSSRALLGRQVLTHEDEAPITTPEREAVLREAGVLESRYMALPLIFGDVTLGIMSLTFKGRRPFTKVEYGLYQGIARSVAQAVWNARVFESEQQSAALSASLNDLDQWIHSSLDFAEVAQRALESATRTIGADSSAIDGAADGIWTVWFDYGFEPSIQGHTFTDEQNQHGVTVIRTERILAIDDAYSDPRVDNETMRAYGIHSVIVAPLIVRGRAIAALYFNYLSDFHRFTDREVDFVTKVASSLSLALENARLYESHTQRTHFAEALNRINAAVHSSLEADQIMSRIVVEVTEALGVNASAVHMRLGDHWEFTHAYRIPRKLAYTRLSDDDARMSVRIVETGETVVYKDTSNEGQEAARLLERFGITAVVGVPLIVRGQGIGVLYTGRLSGIAEFTDEQVDFVRKAAATLALALENARLYETEHDIAEKLQEALLALPEKVHGIEFASSYHSAAEAARVGGDFYDIFEVDRDHIVIVVGDVAGKGLDAAVLTSMVKNTIRAHANDRRKSPQQILASTNEVIYKATVSEAFVTVFLGILDCTDGHLIYGNAGHTTAALSDGKGRVSKLPTTGPLLGAFEDAPFSQAETHMEPNELLFLYTDGLTEARRNGEFYGEERLFCFLQRTESDPSVVIQAVVDDVVAFSGGQLRDDLAILAVKRVEPGPHVARQQRLDV